MRFSVYILLSFILTSFSFNLSGQDKVYHVDLLNAGVPVIDGHIEDEAWQNVPWEKGFTQREPYQGAKPSEETAFKIIYDDNFLYIAVRAYDNHPDSIVKRLSRRDNIEGDYLGVHIDSYDDKRTAFVFNVSAAGVKSDWVSSDDGNNRDLTWDPIWYVKTHIDDLGWTAEMKIPFTQLRFSKKGLQEWGFQVIRNIYRHDEEIHWQLIPKNSSGWVSRLSAIF